MASFPWWQWTILAAALALAELVLPGSYLIFIALGAAATAAIDAIWGLSFEGELGCFAAASAVSCLVGFFVYRRFNHPQDGDGPLNRKDQSMVGARGIVFVALNNGQGKVKLGDTVWLAKGPNLPEGAPVVVRSARDAWVTVEAAP
jgi:inner membrane protein